MTHVLFIGMTPNYGGLETYMMNIFSNLEGKGFKFDFVNTYNKPIAYTNFIHKHGGIIKHVHINRSHIGLFSRYFSAKHFFKNNHNYDVVYLNTLSLNNIYWLKAASHFNIPKLIIHSHDCNFVHNSKLVELFSKLLSIWNRKFLKHPKITEFAVSKNAGQWMFHNNNFIIIRNGINTKKFSFNEHQRIVWRKRLHIKRNEKVFITVAKLTSQKNYNKIVHIFYYIHKINSSTKLIIIGDGIEKNRIKSLIRLLHLQNNVIFLGIINNVNELLNVADLMIMPSKYEGFPFALVESQSVGVPAIVSSKAIPKSSNITHTLKYVSLNNSSYNWAKTALNMTKYKINRLRMNKCVSNSPYTVNYLVHQIKKYL